MVEVEQRGVMDHLEINDGLTYAQHRHQSGQDVGEQRHEPILLC